MYNLSHDSALRTAADDGKSDGLLQLYSRSRENISSFK